MDQYLRTYIIIATLNSKPDLRFVGAIENRCIAAAEFAETSESPVHALKSLCQEGGPPPAAYQARSLLA